MMYRSDASWARQLCGGTANLADHWELVVLEKVGEDDIAIITRPLRIHEHVRAIVGIAVPARDPRTIHRRVAGDNQGAQLGEVARVGTGNDSPGFCTFRDSIDVRLNFGDARARGDRVHAMRTIWRGHDRVHLDRTLCDMACQHVGLLHQLVHRQRPLADANHTGQQDAHHRDRPDQLLHVDTTNPIAE